MRKVPEDLVDFMEGGVSILIGTCDAQGLPEVARGIGATVSTYEVLSIEHVTDFLDPLPPPEMLDAASAPLGDARAPADLAARVQGHRPRRAALQRARGARALAGVRALDGAPL